MAFSKVETNSHGSNGVLISLPCSMLLVPSTSLASAFPITFPDETWVLSLTLGHWLLSKLRRNSSLSFPIPLSSQLRLELSAPNPYFRKLTSEPLLVLGSSFIRIAVTGLKFRIRSANLATSFFFFFQGNIPLSACDCTGHNSYCRSVGLESREDVSLLKFGTLLRSLRQLVPVFFQLKHLILEPIVSCSIIFCQRAQSAKTQCGRRVALILSIV